MPAIFDKYYSSEKKRTVQIEACNTVMEAPKNIISLIQYRLQSTKIVSQ